MRHIPTLGPRGEGWVILQVVLLAVAGIAGLATVAGIGPFLLTATGTYGTVVRIAGAAILVFGAIQARRGVRDLGSNLTPLPQPTDDSRLVQTGIYRRVRHPIYGGIILMAIGWALLTASLVALVIAALLIPFFWLKSSLEEAWLAERFTEYAAYRSGTRRFIAFPGSPRGRAHEAADRSPPGTAP